MTPWDWLMIDSAGAGPGVWSQLEQLGHPIRARGGTLGQLASGFQLLFEGLSLLRRERSLWRLAAIPLGLSVLALLGAGSAIVVQADAIHGFASGWLPNVESGAWYTWLWVGPARAALAVAGALLFLLASGAIVVLALLLANLVAAPALDLLSQRVELVVEGGLVESGDSGLSGIAIDVGRSLANEARRLAFLIGVWAVLLGVGLVIPGGQLVAPPLMVLVTILFLPLEYSGHVLDRRQVPFRVRRSWLRAHLPRMLGFGTAAFLTGLVPGLNLLIMPGLVVAGTLLALRYPPDAGLGSPLS
jgi:uncharacterized protein involved in cysteine biosynthesis